LIERAVDAIGWDAFCNVDEDDMGTLRAQFRDALRVIQNREVDRVVSGRATDVTGLTAVDQGQRDARSVAARINAKPEPSDQVALPAKGNAA
jgi:hypothetical protein